MNQRTDDLRVESLRPLIPPAIVLEEIPLLAATEQFVAVARQTVAKIVRGEDSRLLVVCGPCSVHDPAAALDYAKKLAAAAEKHAESLYVVMRTYFEKPRTTVGWKGLINDPRLDESFQINKGLRIARGLLRDITAVGLPTATEFLDPITPQYVADLVAWGAIGARTTESQTHREMASGLSMPIGFKNATSGAVQVALDAIRSSQHRHHFLGVTKQGLSAIIATRGNPDCHIILRGGETPNYDAAAIAAVAAQLAKAGLPPRIMIDCSHGNSSKDHAKQPLVADNIAEQLIAKSPHILGVMLESFLVAGRQDLQPGRQLTYGQSITDACMDWATTAGVLERLARAAARRRD